MLPLRRLSLPLLAALCLSCARSPRPASRAVSPTPRADAAVAYTPTPREAALLDTLGERTFRWFWDTTDPRTGLTPDRWPRRTFSSVAAIGFALTAYPVGAERGWITHAQAAERTLATLRSLWQLPQGPAPTGVAGHKGFFYHFLEYDTGHRFKTVELSTIDTALLLGGALFCQSYFTDSSATHIAIRAYADSLYRRVEWPWAMARPPALSMGWHPERGFIRNDWTGYNEGMIALVLGLGSPTHPLPASSWDAWTGTYAWREFMGERHLDFAPLFGHQYSHVWIDFRGIRDAYMRQRDTDYFGNSVRASRAQHRYAVENPLRWRGYDADVWGLTASDGPLDGTVTINGEARRFFTYRARGVSSAERVDDGTIAPTAALGSIVFTPQASVRAAVAMRERFGGIAWGQYGFLDAFNPTLRDTTVKLQHGRVHPQHGWVDGDYLGIDQGPILTMLENWRTELVWRVMQRNPYIQRGLRRAGFTGGWLESASPAWLPQDGTPEIIGHRGAAGLAPENTLAAFARACAVGVHGIELDVHLTADSVLVVHHDYALHPDLTRDANGAFSITDPRPLLRTLTARDVRRYDVGRLRPGSDYAKRHPEQVARDGERIPTLDEVITLFTRQCAPPTRLVVEIKTDPTQPAVSAPPEVVAERTVAQLRARGVAHRSQIIAFDWRAAMAAQRFAPEIPTSYLTFEGKTEKDWNTIEIGRPGKAAWMGGLDVDDFGGSLPRAIAAAGGRNWSPNAANVTRARVDEAHRLGLRVYPWTVNDPAEMARMLDLGVDGITTDRPDLLREVVTRRAATRR